MNLTSDELRERITDAITGPIPAKQENITLVGTAKDYALESREGPDR